MLHATPHPAVVHVALPLPVGGEHCLPHTEQLFGSVIRLVHVPVQGVGFMAEQPVAHEYVVTEPITLPVHTGAVEGHTVLQSPQRAGFVTSASQPSSGIEEQCA